MTMRTAMLILFVTIAGCGDGGSESELVVLPIEGSKETKTITSLSTGTKYGLNIYLPPVSAGPRNQLPVLYALDGEHWFDTLVSSVEANRQRAIIVAVDTAGQRSRDFVPFNTCTSNGGGHSAYLNFIEHELIPFVETQIGGGSQRALFGHSHGASFALYAMFSKTQSNQLFKTVIASDSSVACMSTEAYGWEQNYAHTNRQLPVALHLSYATQGNITANVNYSNVISQRKYAELSMVSKSYVGSHIGIVPSVLNDALPFAFSNASQ